ALEQELQKFPALNGQQKAQLKELIAEARSGLPMKADPDAAVLGKLVQSSRGYVAPARMVRGWAAYSPDEKCEELLKQIKLLQGQVAYLNQHGPLVQTALEVIINDLSKRVTSLSKSQAATNLSLEQRVEAVRLI